MDSLVILWWQRFNTAKITNHYLRNYWFFRSLYKSVVFNHKGLVTREQKSSTFNS